MTAPFDLISVAIFGHPDPDIMNKLLVAGIPDFEADGFRGEAFPNDDEIDRHLADIRPQVIFSFGDINAYPRLLGATLDVRRRWLHFDDVPEPHELAAAALGVFVDVATRERFAEQPLVSVFTPTFESGPRLLRPYRSLLAQTYTNWEWVVYDDSPGDQTFETLRALAHDDPRIRVFRGDRNCGVIGEVKRRLCGLARGRILVELDHDDELTANCLNNVIEAFHTYPDAGFVYTDCAEIFEDGQPATYGEGWGLGFGSYRREIYRGNEFLVTNYPSINAKTMRHIVGVPNHVRAWRREAYEATGGFGSEIHVADDYEIMIRTFLTTRMVHVQRFGYIQYMERDGSNTQRRRNKEIQRLVRLFHERYEAELHQRFVELGVDDFIWRDGWLDWTLENPVPPPIANYVLV
jgi:glycosyltransferase involved in cell wall biosynthesis